MNYNVEWNDAGNMTGKFPWDALKKPGDVVNVYFQAKPQFVRSVQTSAYSYAKKHGVTIIVRIIAPGHCLCELSEHKKDGRRGRYSAMHDMKVGDVLKFPWDLSQGTPAPEYRALSDMHRRVQQERGFKLDWTSNFHEVTITRLA